MTRAPPPRWSRTAQALHWSVALLVLAQLPLGFLAVGWRMSPTKLDLFVWHKSLGFVVLALMLLRLSWRATHAAPAPPPDASPWTRRAAAAVHALLYGVLFALPLTGWIVNSAANVPFRVFRRIPVPAIVAPDKALADDIARLHLALAVLLLVLLVVHVGAALWHHHRRRDDVLLRMLPRAERRP